MRATSIRFGRTVAFVIALGATAQLVLAQSEADAGWRGPSTIEGAAGDAPEADAQPSASDELPELLVFLKPGADAARLAGDHGLVVHRVLRSGPECCILRAGGTTQVKAALPYLAADGRVRAAFVNHRTHYERVAFVPDDPCFHKDTPAAGWPGQWHLVNEYVPGLDVRVQGAWNRDITGSGVVIGIVDDSFETTHPDLAPNYVSADSWDFGQDDSVPDPVYEDDGHGICVAGCAAARGGNGIGVTGAAPLAGLAGLRIDFANQTEADFVDATLYHSSGGNTNIAVKNHSYGLPSTYIDSEPQRIAFADSAAASTIHCLAAGNDRGSKGQDANKKDIQSSPDVITVAALGNDGVFAYYSNFGACVFATAPSGEWSDPPGFGVLSTDRTGEAFGFNGALDSFPDPDYSYILDGTSFSAPVAAGVMALVKQVQPTLNVRFAKHLLARTCDVVDPNDATTEGDGGWKTNAAGYTFNQNYGFGLINADELTVQAAQYTGVTPQTTATTGAVTVGASIPDNDPNGVASTFTINATEPLEEVLVHLNVTHTWRGDIEARLTSPSGTTSRLMIRSSTDYFNDINWTFCTNAFWGENPGGTWALRVCDVFAGDVGTWQSYTVTVRMGDMATTEPSITTGPQSQTKCAGQPVTFSVAASGAPPLSYQWRKNGTSISGAASSSFTISSVTPGDAGSYDCVVSNTFGSATSNAATLTVNMEPSVTTQPQSQTKCEGQSVTFSVAASGTLPLAYQWRKNGTNISGATSSSYTISSVTPDDAGSYDCVVSNTCGSATSNAATLTLGTSARWHLDADNDRYGDAAHYLDQCEQPSDYVLNDDDCDDGNPNVNPAAMEVCGDGIDNDCQNGDAACTGACCVGANCQVLTQAACGSQGGTYKGDNMACSASTCELPTGACCVGADCQVLTQATCASQGGTYKGDNVACGASTCGPPTGACCVGASCQVLTQAACGSQGGTYQGDKVACGVSTCELLSIGACCVGADCQVLTQAACGSQGGTYQGENVACGANTCESTTGACCLPGGSCVETTESACNDANGAFLGNGSACDGNPCRVIPCDTDSDGDDVCDTDDQCPNTPAGEQVDADGCSCSQLDDDGDGVSNCEDACPNASGSCPDGCSPRPTGLCPGTSCGLIGLSLAGLWVSRRRVVNSRLHES